MVTVLAVLQNMWFNDPVKAREVFARNKKLRNRLIKAYLFMGCLTGRRLERALGDELCDQIIWEEASPEIGGKSSALFRGDPEHVRRAIQKHRPDIVAAFGAEARRVVAEVWRGPVVYGPHPAARGARVVPELADAARELNRLIAEHSR